MKISDYIPFLSSYNGLIRLLDLIDTRDGRIHMIAINSLGVQHSTSKGARLGRAVVTLIPFVNLLTLPYDFVIRYINYRKFSAGLSKWVDEAPPGEKGARQTAAEKIRNVCKNKETTLDLKRLGLSTLPPELRYLRWLKVLDVSHNNMREIPNELTELVRLEEIDLSHNQITAIPDGFFKIESLRIFRASHNGLTQVPLTFHERFRNLEELDYSHNNLAGALYFHGNLQKLKKLNLSNNKINIVDLQYPFFIYWAGRNSGIYWIDVPGRFDFKGETPPNMVEDCLLGLEELDLSNNDLIVEPPMIATAVYVDHSVYRLFRCTNLKRLSLSGNEKLELTSDTKQTYSSVLNIPVPLDASSQINALGCGCLYWNDPLFLKNVNFHRAKITHSSYQN